MPLLVWVFSWSGKVVTRIFRLELSVSYDKDVVKHFEQVSCEEDDKGEQGEQIGFALVQCLKGIRSHLSHCDMQNIVAAMNEMVMRPKE